MESLFSSRVVSMRNALFVMRTVQRPSQKPPSYPNIRERLIIVALDPGVRHHLSAEIWVAAAVCVRAEGP